MGVAAEHELREGFAMLDEIGESAIPSIIAAELALMLARQGRNIEAEAFAAAGQQAGIYASTQILIASARAWIKAGEESPAQAVTLGREAVALADATDFLHDRLTARLALAVALQSAGDLATATEAAHAAEALAQEKGDIVCAERARDLIARLEAPGANGGDLRTAKRP